MFLIIYFRVYGISGLRVVDASIMPTIMSGNPVGELIELMK